MGRSNTRQTPTTIDGMVPAVTKKVLRYVFGNWFYALHQKGYEWHVILLNEVEDINKNIIPVDKDLIEDFLNFWGRNFYKFKIIKKEDTYEG